MPLPTFPRELSLKKLKSSAFLLGPRMTGKTTLLREIPQANYFDLLDSQYELEVKANPKRFWEEISMLPDQSRVIVDEIQKAPLLLNYVQMGMDQKKLRFILSGSSTRKLKRGGTNLLGGRAHEIKIHPLTMKEIGPDFKLDWALQWGTLPRIYQLLLAGETEEAIRSLKSYSSIYLREEIQDEAITRNLGAFQRFLNIAAQSNAQIIEFANISRECSVPSSTVKEYFSILADTLIGNFLWPYDRCERKKARPKFYLFDCGVVRSLQNRLIDPPTPSENGFLFETWFLQELIKIRDYEEKPHQIELWRKGIHEIDFLISGGKGPLLAIECKSGNVDLASATLKNFRNEFPQLPLMIASLNDTRPRKLATGAEVHPFAQVLEAYRQWT